MKVVGPSALVMMAVLGAGIWQVARAQDATRSFEIYGFAQADYIQDTKRVDPAWQDAFRPSKIATPEGEFGSNGQASVSRDDPLMQRFAGAQLLVRIRTRAIFPNCPRYIVTPGAAEPSKYAPRPGYQPPEPAWKGFDDFKDYIHPRQKTPNGE